MKVDDLVGTWRLREFRLTDAKGNVNLPWHPDSSGILIYTADGFMSAAVSTVQAGGGGASVMTYCGPFDFDGKRLIHHIELSSDNRLIGTDQTRLPSLEDGVLTLTSSPSLFGGPGTSAALVWKRA